MVHLLTSQTEHWHSTTLASLAALTVPQHKDAETTPIFPSFAYHPDRFIRLWKKPAISFLKFLIILLLMSSHGHANNADLISSKAISTSTKIHISADPLCVPSKSSPDNLYDSPDLSPKFLFPPLSVRLKGHRFDTSDFMSSEVHHTTQPG